MTVNAAAAAGYTTLTELKTGINAASEINDDLRAYLGYQVDASGNIDTDKAGALAWNWDKSIPSGGATPAHWFLPSYAQWQNIMGANGAGKGSNYRTSMGLITSDRYLSSTENDSKNAYNLYTTGNMYSSLKSLPFYVRAVFAY